MNNKDFKQAKIKKGGINPPPKKPRPPAPPPANGEKKEGQ
ncbi:hypothetical protein JOC77_004109 [Peribacillus deserti]|uniref:Spore protein n=1 Tax=Peribacillus deserti TaxID=673318 RepID=A0ABS2QPI1_9BACI|nr:hypothetical protein [Peribacillus deserti]